MSEQGHHQGRSFLPVSPWLPWRKRPVFGRAANLGYPHYCFMKQSLVLGTKNTSCHQGHTVK